MTKQRMEAFSDGVLAIIITIMVLEIQVPSQPTFTALFAKWHLLVSYILSFVYVGIYWNNHNYLVSSAKSINGRYLWYNLFLLFWLSLLPVSTAWIGRSFYDVAPAVTYGFVLTLAGLSYQLLQRETVKQNGSNSELARSIGKNIKGNVSLILYLLGTIVAFFAPVISYLFYVAVAIWYFVPDKRVEKIL